MPTISAGIDSAPAAKGALGFEAAVAKVIASANTMETATHANTAAFNAHKTASDNVGGGLGGLTLGFAAVAAAAAAMAAAVVGGARGVVAASDDYTLLKSRLDNLTTSGVSSSAVLDALSAASERARAPVGDLAGVYLKNAQALEQMGKTQGDGIKLTETLSKVITLSGASASEAKAGMYQLSQAIASGKFQGDEFRSVAENMPAVLRLLQTELGVSAKQLRHMAEAGQLTGDVLVNTLLRSSGKVDESFAKLAQTSGFAFTQMTSEVSMTVGKMGESAKVSQEWAKVWDEVRAAVKSPEVKAGLEAAANGVANLAKGMRAFIPEAVGASKAFGDFITRVGESEAFEKLSRVVSLSLGIINAEIARSSVTDMSAGKAAVDWMLKRAEATGFASNAFKDYAKTAAIEAAKAQAAWVTVSSLATSDVGKSKLKESEAQKLLTEQRMQNEIMIAQAAGDREKVATLTTQLEIKKKITDELKEGDKLAAAGLAGEIARTQQLKMQADYQKQNDATVKAIGELRVQAEIQGAIIAGDEKRVRALELELELNGKITLEMRKANPILAEQLADAVRLNKVNEKRVKDHEQLVQTGEQLAQTMADGLLTGIKQGQSFGQTVKDITLKVIEMGIQIALIGPMVKSLGQQFAGLMGGGGGGGGIGGLLGMFGQSSGPATLTGWEATTVPMFANGGVVDSPTLFSHGGGMGIAGEAGPEAIMPLRRGSDGKMGVAASGGSSGGSSGGNSAPVTINLYGDPTPSTIEQMRTIASQIFGQNAPQLVRQSVRAVQDMNLRDPRALRR